MLNPKLFFSFLTLSFLFTSFPQSDYLNDFQKAVKFYSDKKYYQALSLFDKVISDYPENSKTTASILFKGKTLLSMNNLAEAKSISIDFLNKYSSSKHADEARFLLTEIYITEKDYVKAFGQLLNVIQSSSLEQYLKDAEKEGENLVLNFLTVTDIKNISNFYKDEKVKSYLLLVKAKLQIDQNSFGEASESLNELIKLYPKSHYKNEAEILLSKISGKELAETNNKTIICAMLPLSGLSSNEELTASKEILEGIKFALDEFNNGRDDKIGLLIRDTENERNRIMNIKSELANNPSIKLIIGPVFSNEVRIALEEFNSTDLPIISPTATDNELTQINENFFQANPNFVIRAKAMAQYIFYVENKRRMAVLNSIGGYSPLLAAEFSAEFEKLGGEIIAKYTYKSDNLSSGIKIDSTELVSAEGLYIPISDKMDAPLILSQLVQNNINIQLYGNQDWFLAKGFETSPELSNKMIFESDYFIEYNSNSYQDFNKIFLARTKYDANRNVLYGYDAAKYILTVLRNISRDRKNIRTKIESGIAVNGFHNNISINKNHVNVYLNIIRYRDGFFELVDKFKVSN